MKAAIVIPTYENNIGFKLAALDTYLKHVTGDIEIIFLYGGNDKKITRSFRSGVSYLDVYIDVPERITTLHKKFFKFLKTFKKSLLSKYDFIIKIDDDTFINNIDDIDFSKIRGDFIGNKVKIDEISEDKIRKKLINLKRYKERNYYKHELPESFLSGECLIISKKSLEVILNYKGSLKRYSYGFDDIFISKILSDNKIKFSSNKIISYEHPVTEQMFYKLYLTHYNGLIN